MGVSRLKLMRSEISGALDAGESNNIFNLTFDPAHTQLMVPTDAGGPDQGLTSPKPLAIYSYDMLLASDHLCQAFQFYCDAEDAANASNWDVQNTEFLQSLKKHKLAAGAIGYSGSGSSSQWHTQNMSFRSRGYWSKKHKEYRWTVPPIILSNNKKNYVGFSVANVSGSDDRSYYALVTINRWAQFT